MRELEVTSLQAGQRLDRLLGKYLREASPSFLYKMLRKKNITLNGRKADGSEKVKQGDVVRIFFAEKTLEKFTGTRQGNKQDRQSLLDRYPFTQLDILYEDANILLINKKAGMLTQKAHDEDCSLNEYAVGYLLRSGALSSEDLLSFRPSVCNRLDRNTSGIVAVGKSVAGLQELSAMFHDRTVHKYYRTIVLGRIEEGRMIEGYLSKDEAGNRVRILKEPSQDAQPIRTRYTPLFISPGGKSGHDLTCLEVELITGRSHQIRAHLRSVGHAVVGDPKYGDPGRNDYFRRQYQVRRQLLHADHITFPKTEGCLKELSGRTFRAPLPDDFRRVAEGERMRRLSGAEQDMI